MCTVFVKVYGCKVNQYELQLLREQLAARGFRIVSQLREADVVLVNTCTVTRGSDKELEYFVRKTKKDFPRVKIYLVGCYVNSHRDSVATMEDIDGFFVNDEKNAVVAALCEEVGSGSVVGSSVAEKMTGISHFTDRTRAFVKIQDGCDRVCSYCIVRLVRGKSRSRAVSEIIAEVKRLAHNGFKEIVLAGVQIGAYGNDAGADISFPALLSRIATETTLSRIRISSIEPFDITDELITCMEAHENICNHLHISKQSGDDAVLSRMRRGYSQAFLRDRLTALHARLPGFAYSTDIIAGFPGESDDAFQQTIALLASFPPMKVHAFPYSERVGTAAVTLDGSLPTAVRKERVRRLLHLSVAWFHAVATPYQGTRQGVLIEQRKKIANTHHYIHLGKMMNYIPVHVEGVIEPSCGNPSVVITEVADGYLRATL